MSKSQISIEFLFAIGIVFFIFLIIFGFMMNRSEDLNTSETELNKRNTCLLISSLLTSAFVGGDGTIINESIDYDMNVTYISPNYNELNVDGVNCISSIDAVSNSILSKGNIKIENQNNYVDIDNV